MSDGIAQNDLEVSAAYLCRVENLPAFADVEELRWKTLIGNDGEKIGTIENVERDEDTDRVEFLQVGRGGFLGFGAERFLVPVTAILSVDDKHVTIDRPLQTLQNVPEYDHDRMHDSDYCEGVRAWWCEPDGSEVSASEPGAPNSA